MKQLFYRLCDLVEWLFKGAGFLLFCIMIVAVFYEVVMRYVFNAPTFWSEPLARNAMIWMVLLGLAVGIRHKDNICVDFIDARLPERLKPVAAWLRFGFAFAFAAVLLIYGWKMASVNLRQTITGLGLPVFYIQMVVPIAAFGMLLFLVELIVKGDRGRF
ncbi:MAG: TRAP transporter small permease [Pseudomonadota bacterium]